MQIMPSLVPEGILFVLAQCEVCYVGYLPLETPPMSPVKLWSRSGARKDTLKIEEMEANITVWLLSHKLEIHYIDLS